MFLRDMWTRVPTALAAMVLGIAAMLVVLLCVRRDDDHDDRPAQTAAFLAAHARADDRACPYEVPIYDADNEQACTFARYADVDHDGVLDCWRGQVGAIAVEKGADGLFSLIAGS